ncbi:MAG: nucleoside hydrolase [Anaerolineaceae bacterium]|jgi:pyrimidine-specific ribonucleoside hydrolase|nr:nucleoside hydrolase [Anaerolineaceae bacterium]MDI9530233.1 nucleoside hydrolase [Chloroflexota bacterium]NLE93036.1 pyrimidine-specific ribonucleoside hydrolase RihA [Chloroflexota bacterium]HNZ15784.1 nucleoside hydrolase [Anaerolineaceae bacterium]
MTSKIPIILDGDPGHDDAIAWMLAKASDKLEILACTSVSGNQSIEKTSLNARRVMTLLGIDAPFAMGREEPLHGEPIHAANVHGETGLDGPALPEPALEPEPVTAVELMAKTISASSEPVTIVATGPLTNVGALLILYPELKPKIAHISIMGGGLAFGNWTPAAEFNILIDPEAADVVYKSGVPLTMAGLDVTLKALVFPEDFERIRALGNRVAVVVAEWLDFFYNFHRSLGYTGAPVHDAVAVAALIKPEILTARDYYVQIETSGDFCRGATVADHYGFTNQPPNTHALVDIDREAFVDLLAEAAAWYGKESE